jgi:hypothetical protein
LGANGAVSGLLAGGSNAWPVSIAGIVRMVLPSAVRAACERHRRTARDPGLPVFPKSGAQQQFPIAALCGRADTEDIRRDNHDRRWVGTDGWARYRLRRETMSTNNTPIGVRVRMTALSLLTLIGLAVLCIVALVNLKGNLLEDRKLKTRNLVEVALGIVSHYHQLSTRGVLPEADARLAAIATLRDLRYAGTDYFFGFDTNHVYFLLPTKPEFEGRTRRR